MSGGEGEDSGAGYNEKTHTSGYNEKSTDTNYPLPPAHLHKEEEKEGVGEDAHGERSSSPSLKLSDRLRSGGPTASPLFSHLHQEWNKELQETLELPSSQRLLKLRRLRRLHGDFVSVAEFLGKRIIEELNLPNAAKTILPQSGTGTGVAGGTKYIVAGCFFKVMEDTRGLYGYDEYALKAASCELRGLKGIHHSETEGLCIPLVAMIDYRGYRMLVQSMLPLGSDTQCWGSNDGGRTFIDDKDKSVRRRVRTLARRLNLKKHLLMRPTPLPNIRVYGPIDLEIHKGKDGRYYALDAARLMPPTSPPDEGKVRAILVPARQTARLRQVNLKDATWMQDALRLLGIVDRRRGCILEHVPSASLVLYSEHKKKEDEKEKEDEGTEGQEGKAKSTLNERASYFANQKLYGDVMVIKRFKNSHLYHHLRPEAVLQNKVSLNSDAFSNFNASTEEDDNEVREATNAVLTQRIPQLAREMDSGEVLVINSKQLSAELHAKGINVRFLGLLRSQIRSQQRRVQSFLLMEMISRTIKNILRSQMRAVQTPNVEDYREVIVRHFNLVLGSSLQSDRYWKWELKIHLMAKFSEHGFSRTELENDHDLRQHIPSKLALFSILQKHLGVEFKMTTVTRFQEDPTLFEQKAPLSSSDLCISVRLKSLPLHQRELRLLEMELMRLIGKKKMQGQPLDFDLEQLLEKAKEGELTLTEQKQQKEDNKEGIAREVEFGEDEETEGQTMPDYGMEGEFLVKLQEQRQRVFAKVFGEESLESAIGYFKMAEAQSRVENNTLALQLVDKGCEILLKSKVCPAEIIVGFYYLRGSIYERMRQFFNAFRAYLMALEVLEIVYGDARPQGIGMGHPFGLILCCRLAKVAEQEQLFAAAFRFGRRFELLWEVFPLPSFDVGLVRLLFGSPDYLLSFHPFLGKHIQGTNALVFSSQRASPYSPRNFLGGGDNSIRTSSSSSSSGAIKAWLKQISLFDNYSDVVLSTHMLQHDILKADDPAFSLKQNEIEWKKRREGSSNLLKPNGTSGSLIASPTPAVRQTSLLFKDSEASSTSETTDKKTNPRKAKGKTVLVSTAPEQRREKFKATQSMTMVSIRPMHSDHHQHVNSSLMTNATTHVMQGGQLWIWGRGRNGKYDKLTRNLKEPRPLHLMDTAASVASIACSTSHALFTTMDGAVYMLGGTGGLLPGESPLRLSDPNLLTPQPVKELRSYHVVKVACGIGISVVLTDEGKVFVWGSALCRQLGGVNFYTMNTQKSPTLLRNMMNTRVVDVACGGAHTLLLTDKGEVYSFGSGEGGALGHGFYTGDIQIPRRILSTLADVKVRAVAAGEYFSLVLTESGAVYSFGCGDKGQLGHKRPHLVGYRELTPRQIGGTFQNKKITKIACGYDHAMAITEEGDLFMWGSNAHHKLGFRGRDIVATPKSMKAKHFKSASASSPSASSCSSSPSSPILCSSAPTISLVSDNNPSQFSLLDESSPPPSTSINSDTTNNNNHNNSSNQNNDTSSDHTKAFRNALTTRMKRPQVTDIAAGYSHSVAVVNSDKIFTWGSAAWAQLGHGDEMQRKRPTLVRLLTGHHTVLKVAATFGQTLVITTSPMVVGEKATGSPVLGHRSSYTSRNVRHSSFVHKGLVAEVAPNLMAVRKVLQQELEKTISPLKNLSEEYSSHERATSFGGDGEGASDNLPFLSLQTVPTRRFPLSNVLPSSATEGYYDTNSDDTHIPSLPLHRLVDQPPEDRISHSATSAGNTPPLITSATATSMQRLRPDGDGFKPRHSLDLGQQGRNYVSQLQTILKQSSPYSSASSTPRFQQQRQRQQRQRSASGSDSDGDSSSDSEQGHFSPSMPLAKREHSPSSSPPPSISLSSSPSEKLSGGHRRDRTVSLSAAPSTRFAPTHDTTDNPRRKLKRSNSFDTSVISDLKKLLTPHDNVDNEPPEKDDKNKKEHADKKDPYVLLGEILRCHVYALPPTRNNSLPSSEALLSSKWSTRNTSEKDVNGGNGGADAPHPIFCGKLKLVSTAFVVEAHPPRSTHKLNSSHEPASRVRVISGNSYSCAKRVAYQRRRSRSDQPLSLIRTRAPYCTIIFEQDNGEVWREVAVQGTEVLMPTKDSKRCFLLRTKRPYTFRDPALKVEKEEVDTTEKIEERKDDKERNDERMGMRAKQQRLDPCNTSELKKKKKQNKKKAKKAKKDEVEWVGVSFEELIDAFEFMEVLRRVEEYRKEKKEETTKTETHRNVSKSSSDIAGSLNERRRHSVLELLADDESDAFGHRLQRWQRRRTMHPAVIKSLLDARQQRNKKKKKREKNITEGRNENKQERRQRHPEEEKEEEEEEEGDEEGDRLGASQWRSSSQIHCRLRRTTASPNTPLRPAPSQE